MEGEGEDRAPSQLASTASLPSSTSPTRGRTSRRGSALGPHPTIQSTPNLQQAAGNAATWIRRNSRRASAIGEASQPLNLRASATAPASIALPSGGLEGPGGEGPRRASILGNAKVHFQGAGLAVIAAHRAPPRPASEGPTLTGELVEEARGRLGALERLERGDELALVFAYYCASAQKGRFTSMPMPGFTRMLRDCQLYDSALPQVGIDIFFRKLLKLVGAADDGLDFRQFQVALVALALLKRGRLPARPLATARSGRGRPRPAPPSSPTPSPATTPTPTPRQRQRPAPGRGGGEGGRRGGPRGGEQAAGPEAAGAWPEEAEAAGAGGGAPGAAGAGAGGAGPETVEEAVERVVEGHVLRWGKREKALDPIKEQMRDPKVEGLLRHAAEHVQRLFVHYAMQDKRNSKKAQEAAGGKIKRQLNLDLFITFTRQFGIFPTFATLSELTRIFRSTNDNDDVNIDAAEFREALCRLALLMFRREPGPDGAAPADDTLFDKLYDFFGYLQTPYKRHTFVEWRLPPKHARLDEEGEGWDGPPPLEEEYWHVKWANVAKRCPDGATRDVAVPRLIEEVLAAPPAPSARVENALHASSELLHSGQPLAAVEVLGRAREEWEARLLRAGGARRAPPEAILKSFLRRGPLSRGGAPDVPSLTSALPLAAQVYLLQAQAAAHTAADQFDAAYEALQVARLVGVKSSPDWRRDAQLATTFAMMGSVAFHKGLFEDAAVEFEQALQIREEVHGGRHVQTAALLNNVGACELMQGRILQALDYFTRAHKALAALHAPENPRTRIALWNCNMAKGLRLKLAPVFRPPPTREDVQQSAARSAKLRARRLKKSGSEPGLPLLRRQLAD
eukprot:tig00000520_g1820.t1